MINIEEKRGKKATGYTTLHISFNYKQEIVDIVKQCEGAQYDKKEKIWEVPITNLTYLLDYLTPIDDINLKLFEEKPKQYIKYEQPQTNNDKIKLFKHQEEAVEFGLNNNKWLLLDVAGLGKSLSLIKLAEELKEREGIEHCLIICGLNSLKRNWKSEIKKCSNLDSIIIGEYISKKGTVYTKSIAERIEQLKNPIKEFFVIINIESLRDEKIVDAIMKGKNKFQMIGFDEMHMSRNSQSLQGKNCLKTSAKYQIGMTGTLLLNNPLDTYFALKWIGAENSSFTNFRYHYCVYGGPFNNELVGYQNTDQLKEQIEKYSLRRTKDIIKGLPPKNIINEFVEMDDKQSKFYEGIKQGILKERKSGVRLLTQNLLAMTTRFRQATECPSILTNEDIPSAKIDRCVDLCDQILSDPNEKIVIFSYFKETCNVLMERLSQYNPVLCTGEIPDNIVDQRKYMFNNDDEHRILIGTGQKMGTGHSLNAKCSYLICLGYPYTFGMLSQWSDRVHRVDNKRPAFIYLLWTLDTFDEYQKELIDMKGAIADYIIDDELSPEIMDKLKKYIEELK